MIEYQEIYNLSKSYGPPKINIRQGQIMDDYGDDSLSKLQINHVKPDDVTLEELEYYRWPYPFLKPRDLLFYLYPLLVEFKKDMTLDCFDSFMYSMDWVINDLQKELSSDQVNILKNAFLEIWDLGGDGFADWSGCLNLQKFVGLL